MGIFYKQVEVINRTSKKLTVRYDGQDVTIQPNYTPAGTFIEEVHNMIPEIVVPYARAQCVLMGSEDPIDPSLFEPLIGVKDHKKHDTSYQEQSTNPTRVDLEDYLDEPGAKIVPRGRRVRLGEARSESGQTPFDGNRLAQ